MAIIITRENIYGIDVFRFFTKNKTPYQLTFEQDLDSDRINVHLMNLYATEPKKYDSEIRKTVCDIVHEYLRTRNCKLYFEIETSYDRNDLKLVKFIKWASLYPGTIFRCEITTFESSYFAEVHITKKSPQQMEVKF